MLNETVLSSITDTWDVLYSTLAITTEDDYQFRVPSKLWLKEEVIEIAKSWPLLKWVSIGAGYDSTALKVIRRDPGMAQYDLTLVDVAYTNPRLARRAYLCLMDSLKQRLGRTIYSEQVPGRSRPIWKSSLDRQISALGYISNIALYDSNLLCEPVGNLRGHQETASHSLKKAQEIAALVGVNVEFIAESFDNVVVPADRVLELMNVINYVNGDKLIAWIKRHQDTLPMILFSNSDDHLPHGDESFRHPQAMLTADFYARLLDELGYVPVRSFYDPNNGAMAAVMIHQECNDYGHIDAQSTFVEPIKRVMTANDWEAIGPT